MSKDAEDWRTRAKDCRDIAAGASNPEWRRTLSEIADGLEADEAEKHWEERLKQIAKHKAEKPE